MLIQAACAGRDSGCSGRACAPGFEPVEAGFDGAFSPRQRERLLQGHEADGAIVEVGVDGLVADPLITAGAEVGDREDR